MADFGSKLVTFKSDATGTGQLGIVEGTLSNATNVTVERHIPQSSKAFRFFSSAVTTTTSIRDNWMEGSTPGVLSGYPYIGTSDYNKIPGYGTQITGTGGSANGFDETQTNNASMFTFNNSTQAWVTATNTNTTITAGEAYRLLIRGDRSYNIVSKHEPTPGSTILRSTGTVVTGTRTVSNLSQAAGGWSMVGNPYQSTVDMSLVTFNNVTPYYYVWDPRRATRGAYVSFSIGAGTNNNTGSQVNRYLQPGQAVFVQTNTASGASLVFKEADKGAGTDQTIVFGSTSLTPTLSAVLYYSDSLANQSTEMDALKVLFDNKFSNSVDINDGVKFTNLDETMSVLREGKLVSLELRGMPDMNTVIPISITQYRRQDYTMRMEWEAPLTNGLNAYLVDAYTGEEHVINSSGITDIMYSVDATIAASISATRFQVVFRFTNALPVSGIQLKGQREVGMIKLQWTALNEREMVGYQIERSADGTTFTGIGHQVASGNGQSATDYTYYDKQPKEGTNYYRIKGTGSNGQVQFSTVVAVKMEEKDVLGSMVIVPNPVVNGRLNIRVSHLKKGHYRAQVVDANGRMITQRGLDYDGVGEMVTMWLPSSAISGAYYLKLEGEKISLKESFLIKEK